MFQNIFFALFILMLVIRCYEVIQYKIKLSAKELLFIAAGVLISIAFLLEAVFKIEI